MLSFKQDLKMSFLNVLFFFLNPFLLPTPFLLHLHHVSCCVAGFTCSTWWGTPVPHHHRYHGPSALIAAEKTSPLCWIIPSHAVYASMWFPWTAFVQIFHFVAFGEMVYFLSHFSSWRTANICPAHKSCLFSLNGEIWAFTYSYNSTFSIWY